MAVVALLVASLVGCRKSKVPATPRPIEAPKAPAPVVSRFLVRDITKPVERPCNLFGEIPALGLATLKRSHYFRYRPTEVENLAAYRGGANVLYILSFGPRITPDARVGVLTVGVDLTLQREKPNEPGKETLDVVVRREVPYDQKKHGFIKGYARTIIRAALQEAIARAELLGQSRTLGTATLIARVADPDPLRRDAAIQNLGFRRSKAAVPALLRALRSADKNTVLRTVGALSSIADRRAIEPLAQLLTSSNKELLRAVVFAIGDLGGARAQRILRAQLAKTSDPKLKSWLESAIRTASDSDSD